MKTIDSATVFSRWAFQRLTALDVRASNPSISVRANDGQTRECVELRVHSHKSATLETRILADFDPVKNRWAKDRGIRCEEVSGNAAIRKKAAELLARIDAAGLVRYPASSAQHESWFAS